MPKVDAGDHRSTSSHRDRRSNEDGGIDEQNLDSDDSGPSTSEGVTNLMNTYDRIAEVRCIDGDTTSIMAVSSGSVGVMSTDRRARGWAWWPAFDVEKLCTILEHLINVDRAWKSFHELQDTGPKRNPSHSNRLLQALKWLSPQLSASCPSVHLSPTANTQIRICATTL
jgi:hypothetical protein